MPGGVHVHQAYFQIQVGEPKVYVIEYDMIKCRPKRDGGWGEQVFTIYFLPSAG